MKILFVHQNFPAQFIHLAPALAKLPRYEVRALTINNRPAPPGVEITRYQPSRSNSRDGHPWLLDMETKVIRGEAAYRTALDLKKSGFNPDVIVAHPGWGESLFLKDVWPAARLGIYCEFYYVANGGDTNFDAEFAKKDEAFSCRLRLKNINHDMHFQIADSGISPTHWQRSVFPESFQSRIKVIHDGINTAQVKPDKQAVLQLNQDIRLTGNNEIITFVNRNLEPHRGYHIFMRALPEILRARPNARVIIVGGDEVSYGAQPTNGDSWKNIFLNEVREQLDMSRVHFVGKVPYHHFVRLLQLSTVHVYLTYPFVLSWSLLEAMSAGCAIVASDTAPVREAIRHDVTGLLVDFFDIQGWVDNIVGLLCDRDKREQLGAAARQFAIEHYDLSTICLPRQLEWVGKLGDS